MCMGTHGWAWFGTGAGVRCESAPSRKKPGGLLVQEIVKFWPALCVCGDSIVLRWPSRAALR
jgi:hypothetical protein